VEKRMTKCFPIENYNKGKTNCPEDTIQNKDEKMFISESGCLTIYTLKPEKTGSFEHKDRRRICVL
jgi:hypothetical protein